MQGCLKTFESSNLEQSSFANYTESLLVCLILAILGAVGYRGRAGINATPGDCVRTPSQFCMDAVDIGTVDGGQTHKDAGVEKTGIAYVCRWFSMPSSMTSVLVHFRKSLLDVLATFQPKA